MDERRRRGRGLSQSLQWALLTPLLVLALLGTVQGAIILRAQQSARAAAMAGAEAESWAGAPVGSGADVAKQVAETADLRDVRVQVTRGGGLATVTVTASADLFLDVGQGRVTRTVTIPLEEP